VLTGPNRPTAASVARALEQARASIAEAQEQKTNQQGDDHE
jgi:hypothetical protein